MKFSVAFLSSLQTKVSFTKAFSNKLELIVFATISGFGEVIFLECDVFMTFQGGQAMLRILSAVIQFRLDFATLHIFMMLITDFTYFR